MVPTSRLISSLTAAALLLASFQAFALKTDSEQPIDVVSDEQIADLQNNKAIFLGNVVATQGSIEITCDKAELLRDENGQLKEVHGYGGPVKFRQTLDDGKIIRSQSSVLSYYPLDANVVLDGRATIWQDESHVNGEKIEYNVNTQKMKATNPNAQGGRVKSTFIPAEFKKKDN